MGVAGSKDAKAPIVGLVSNLGSSLDCCTLCDICSCWHRTMEMLPEALLLCLCHVPQALEGPGAMVMIGEAAKDSGSAIVPQPYIMCTVQCRGCK